MIQPVIMAGGNGSRLWPVSRQLNAKQFLTLTDDALSMLQMTIARLDGVGSTPPLLICNEQHRFLAAEQLRQIDCEHAQIILEPAGRNTAPAIALAALAAMQQGQDPVLLILAADHYIADWSAFHQALEKAECLAKQDKLVTFGVVPTLAETGYGYIQRGSSLPQHGFNVARFVEKPDAPTAQRYLDSGDYYWNSGMFMFKASVYLEALREFRPDILDACARAFESRSQDMTFVRVGEAAFANCPEESIDYAVMEKTTDAAVVPLDAGWSDIGSWSALWDIGEKDSEGNVCKGDVLAVNTRNSLIRAEHKLVATLGVEDLVVVETKDAVLVAHKDSVQDVKKIVEAIKNDSRHEHIGENEFLVTENQSTYIPAGQVHCLENPGVIPLELIEVQSGSYLGEDDIVRLQDQYGRT